jgi:hypothetical protein
MTPRKGECLIKTIPEKSAIGQIGEGIEVGEVFQPVFRLFDR